MLPRFLVIFSQDKDSARNYCEKIAQTYIEQILWKEEMKRVETDYLLNNAYLDRIIQSQFMIKQMISKVQTDLFSIIQKKRNQNEADPFDHHRFNVDFNRFELVKSYSGLKSFSPLGYALDKIFDDEEGKLSTAVTLQ